MCFKFIIYHSEHYGLIFYLKAVILFFKCLCFVYIYIMFASTLCMCVMCLMSFDGFF